MPNLSELTDYEMPAPEPIPANIPRVYIGSPGIEDRKEEKGIVQKVTDKLLGLNGEERYQLWPEKVVREGLSAAGDVFSGQTPQWGVDPVTGDVHTSPQMIEKAQAISALAGSGGLAGAEEGAVLNATPSLRPALKYKDKLYKGKPGQEHQDVIPAHLYPEFQQMAMSGEDISHYNFGFVNDKGHFLNREDALKYGIDSGLIDPQAGKFGALTSTLMADSSKPGTAIEAMAKTSQPYLEAAIRDNGKVYKGVDHLDALSKAPAADRGRLALDGNNRGWMNDKGRFLNREKAQSYAVNNKLIKDDAPSWAHTMPEAVAEWIKPRTILKADSSKEGAAIEAMAKADPFFSALEHNVSKIGQSKMTGDQWLGTLSNKPGVKPEELDWTGLKSFLQDNGKASVTKEQIEQHLASNKVELKEVNKGASEYDTIVTRQRQLAEKGNSITPAERNELIELQTKAKELHAAGSATSDPTKYHSYQLQGGENYREMLMTLPAQNKMKWEKTADGITAEGYTIKKEPNGYVTYGSNGRKLSLHDSEEMAKSLVETSKSNSPNTQMYRSSHWDEPNILAHVRMNDRTIDGKKSLHLEEIQSDWHQQGREHGYKELNTNEQKELDQLTKREINPNHPNPLSDQEKIRIADLEKRNGDLPNAPFKKTWHELALKRMIREAAEKGYDRLSWTPGEAQAARYDLSKQVDEVKLVPKNKNTDPAFNYRIDAFKNGERVTTKPANTEEEVAAIVGKEVAKKLFEENKEGKGSSLKGQQLSIGGEGMKGFYDSIIPKAIEKLGKEHGVKVKQGKILEEKNKIEHDNKQWHIIRDMTPEQRKEYLAKPNEHPVHYIDIPQSLRDTAIGKGFPLFSSSHMFTPVSHDPFNEKKKK